LSVVQPEERRVTAPRPSGGGRADLHIHTTYSDGLSTPDQVLDAAVAAGLDVIAITDHDTLQGAWRVRERAAQRGCPLEVVVGVEVTTASGAHLLGLFVERPIGIYQPVELAIEAIVSQGGVCLVPHPLSPLTPSLGKRSIEWLLAGGSPLAGVETANPTVAGRVTRGAVRRHNARWGLAESGGSDAHFPQRVGSAWTAFPGRSAADLRLALLSRTTTAHFQEAPLGRVPATDYLRLARRILLKSPARRVARGAHVLRQRLGRSSPPSWPPSWPTS
jgi:predicted metal-dependent phosphoesterase TrpH